MSCPGGYPTGILAGLSVAIGLGVLAYEIHPVLFWGLLALFFGSVLKDTFESRRKNELESPDRSRSNQGR